MADNTGKVEYSLRVNNENIESDLEEVNKKVEEAAERSADAIIKIEKDKTIMLNEESDKVVKNTEKAAADVSDAWKGAAKESKAAMSDIAGDKRIEIVVEVNTKEAEASIDKIIKDKDIEVDVKANVKEAKADIASLEDAVPHQPGRRPAGFCDASSAPAHPNRPDRWGDFRRQQGGAGNPGTLRRRQIGRASCRERVSF